MLEGPALAIIVIGGTFLSTTVAATVAWIRARDRAIRAEAKLAARPAPAAGDSADVMRALDAIAIEVERISEGQRYLTTRLGGRESQSVSPRSALPAQGRAGRINTPS